MNDGLLLHKTTLGKETSYSEKYDPELLFPIARQINRRGQLGITDESKPFHGVDVWNAYELSWLGPRGKPQVAVATFSFADTTINLIESKSFKLYLNSFSQTQYASVDDVKATLQKDLAEAAGGEVSVALLLPNAFNKHLKLNTFDGECLDQLPVAVTDYDVNSELLMVENKSVEESLYSDLYRSICPVTSQPDWASVLIRYQGNKIQHESLLKYLISFRQHSEFHEQCCERIFMDILRKCAPEKLTVYLCFTRRGGLDINPFRSNFETLTNVLRLYRQ